MRMQVPFPKWLGIYKGKRGWEGRGTRKAKERELPAKNRHVGR